MPDLRKLIVQNFRNIELQELEFCPNLNCICGGNAQGKTNLLDAIHYLSMTRSAFGSSDKYNFRHGCSSFGISGTYGMGASVSKFSIRVGDGEKKLQRDDKPYARISEHIGVLPVVMVSPGDITLVSEGGDERRRFSNAVLSQMDRSFLYDLQKYNRLLTQRNVILKSDNPHREYLETIDVQMSDLADNVFRARSEFASRLEPAVRRHYSELSGSGENVGISYVSDLQKGRLKDILESDYTRDRALRFTTSGPQRDDFVFTLDGEPIRKTGSQGQQKSFLVSLKFAQYDIMKDAYGFPPMLLLDDLFDKLDMDRTGNLLRMVAGCDFGQIFITDTSKLRLQSIIRDITQESCYYEAGNGVFSRQ
ncbi:MAG: DNA replication and repair protein RecF [Bacteroidales bacterium]|nr:DNA replication and repair protein RecF [Bacteroidales bacterium]